jgi:hypothetical protein
MGNAILEKKAAIEKLSIGIKNLKKFRASKEDFQGESAFDPSTVNDPSSGDNVISSPSSGVWQKIGWNTFAATLLDMEYHDLANPQVHRSFSSQQCSLPEH